MDRQEWEQVAKETFPIQLRHEFATGILFLLLWPEVGMRLVLKTIVNNPGGVYNKPMKIELLRCLLPDGVLFLFFYH